MTRRDEEKKAVVGVKMLVSRSNADINNDIKEDEALEVMEWIWVAVPVQQMQKDQSKGSLEMSFQLLSIIHQMWFCVL